ncbi:regulator of G-protein signaling protein-like [Hydractinia symbiolongicarpus]|uniref:regulator of G-protein signaling protein-like n=1 Tax=Hydractinia symbiolongicarpus TaxID=13093 RepID=UPI00254BAD8F|nr:regulator of G-protein signaling protein-like [Hydractinia symbiolongicarpus]
MKTDALSTTESSKESIAESPLSLPPLKASYAKDITKEYNKATLFEALHVEKETAYEADIEDEADIKDSKLSRDELILPVIDSFEKSLTSMMQPGSPPPQIVTPFSSSFVKGNELINSKDRGKKFELLIGALTTDPIAGQPLISYFLKTGNEIAEHNLRFWTASNQVLTDIHNNDTVTRRKQYQVLINLYLSSAANTKVSLTCTAKQELCTLLLKDIGVTRLMETCKAIAETLEPYWEEFLQSDDDSFLRNTTKYKQNILHKGKRTNAFMFSCIGSSDQNGTFGPGFFDEASNTRKEFRGSRMWRAMQLALSISIPKQAEPLSDAEESEGWTSDEFVNETLGKEKVGGSLNIRNLHLLNRQAQRQNTGQLGTLVNSTGLAHNYNGSFRYNKFGPETDDEFNHVAVTEQRLQKASQIKLPRPRCFQDILSDFNQLEGFKRFLAKEDQETPLVFWVAVESMRTTCKTAKARQGRSYGIVKRYFGPSTQNGQDLKCNAEIIKDIPFLEKVTPAMLVSAQACVAKSLEENWFLKYVQTFQDEGGVTGVTLLPIYGNTTTNEVVRCVKQKTRGLWRMFTRNVISFRRGIMHSDTLQMFCDFLKLQHSLNVAQFQANNIDNQNGTTASPKIVINNKLVHTEKLVKDLNFWSEVERYKDFADAVVLCAKLGNYTKDDELVVVKKAYTIVDCFIDSQITPRVQINISNDLAENIINLVQNGIIERGLFHEAALSTFSTLIYFWKKFCLHRFLPKEQIPEQRKLLKSDRSTQIEIRQLALMSNKIKKICLPPDEDCPKIMFSLQLGLRLALQRHNKRRRFDEQRLSATLNPENTDNLSAPPSQHRSIDKIHE